MFNITIQWFWIIEIFAIAVLLGSAYKGLFKTKKKNNVFTWIAILLLIIVIVKPFKIELEDEKKIQNTVSYINNSSIEIPAKVVDNSFNVNSSANGLSEEDIDLFDDIKK